MLRSQAEQLGAAANDRAEEVLVGREAEDVPVDVLPPGLLLLLGGLLVTRVPAPFSVRAKARRESPNA